MDSTTLSRSRRRRLTAALAVGYLALAVGVVAVLADQSTGWELSIYRATPLAFWAGVLLAVAAAAAVALTAPARSVPSRLAIVLGPLAVVAVVALPLLRGYYFFGAGDALSYLGWARLIDRGQLNPLEFLYPGIQTTAIFLSEATGLPLRRTLMTIPALFVIVYVSFVALVVRRIATGRHALAAGAFAALLLLPVNNIHTYLIPYPTSAAIFFAPLVLYCLFRYVTDGGSLLDVGDRSLATPFGALLALTGIATVLYHPQVGANLVAILVAVLLLQALARRSDRWVGDTAVASHRHVAVPAAIVGGFFLLWAPRFDRATGTMAGIVTGLVGGGPTGDEIGARGSSLTELGGGLVELGLRLFTVSAVLSLVAGVVMLAAVARLLDDRSDRSALLTYLTVAAVPIFGLFALFFAASVSEQAFRYLGFLMMLVTIVAGVAYADGLPTSLSLPSSVNVAVTVILVLALLTPQLAMVFMSPHIYQPSSQVTETRIEGYETAFEHRDSDVWFTGIRGGPRRYVDAHYGTSGNDTTPTGAVFEGKEEAIPFAVWGSNMTEFYSRCRYVAVDDSDYQREVGMYDELRYGAEGFNDLETNSEIHRVQSNGDFRLYVVAPEGSTCTQ